ncbi:MAG TPA: aminoacyl-tRNA hydrolase [Leeuwenhoekiella sp.]|uniref:alternative ribosome rescue aminoacyl-tRNA hydrolase ArfB n=1 Tax=Leeuwenhoekiella palythoae TaxID=573501 RepID=UPI000C48BDD6|nr:alternative ribosome rescue aminoacyl-tRNA hydrolase ArfB [Leeuwenhoekiella palythoae]MAS20592.1 aminoacyl-tRNA hydrolase [Leeuwenhoekiella sp.]MBH13134.1 aminoacyl-tRNA hydrolase [Leeuwenhoekiella sp.]UBZ12099.1 aminoacyl-tRNA hydrolase [Leeuwenhoekiella palythoae]HBO29789.1 aminoacyl-tRNA hydrolase [Leeuwenhoekiella sp.]HCQ77140.1 aminoacyl-tRNA hydrolase [Leeuwenhoekiella sp.]|tara:strand:- start:823 stop:1224 length:402 start_codon:yes stop_codon:yes gene_type:complete
MNKEALLQECDFKAVRSSGPGGQHVNKTSTKVMLHWSLKDSNVFSEEEKERLFKRLKSKLTSDDQLVLSYDQSRSQHKNKDEVFKNLVRLLENGLLKPKRRKKTKPTLASKKRRLDSKKRNAEKKANRKPPSF